MSLTEITATIENFVNDPHNELLKFIQALLT